jgi:NtrC-family two-component system sensor histidine kinase KinB
MEYLKKFNSQVRTRLFALLIIDNLIFLGDWFLVEHILHLTGYKLLATLVVVPLASVTILPWLSTRYLTQPTKLISEAILHIMPSATEQTPTPDPASARFGKELVASLIHQVYQLATLADQNKNASVPIEDLHANFIADSLPLPLITLDSNQNVIFANEIALKYLVLNESDIIGKNFYSLLDMSFPSEQTFDTWLANAKQQTVTATSSWERVRLNTSETRPLRLFDLAAYYNKDNPSHIETVVVLFDHTKQYIQDDQAVSFIALSVHELRTPLTLLRGYIEAFEEEFAGKLDPEMNDFMFKMSASAQQLAAFVNNILNVARVDDDQLVLQLHEENWADIVRAAANNMALRAKVRGITVEYSIAPDLPTVGVDRVSILEVINNLVDNAIKYSGTSKKIRISTQLGDDGRVETSVQDFGVGIAQNILQHLFTKFYRDHHNRAQIGGTGLGLYLSKALVTAHGGNIWVTSKVGEGSTFTFTLVPYSQLTDELKHNTNKEITRAAHGWIKNHSLYRR